MKTAQISTASFASRYMPLLEDLRDAAPRARKMPSIGSSSSFEALDLRRVFLDARIFGCDISGKEHCQVIDAPQLHA